ncbi:MAG: hypothetical protein AB7G93_06065 [Bdellovibrionales bacterium]
MKKLWMTAPIAMLFAFSTWAGDANKAKQASNATQVEDVETLMDNVSQYTGKTVSVKGEVKDRVGDRGVVVESGGMLNNEIVVLSSDSTKQKLSALTEDEEVQVTGRVVTKPVAELKREYAWSLDQETESKLRDVKAYLIADDIMITEKAEGSTTQELQE